MTAQILEQVLKCYRIGDTAGKYPIFDAAGSMLLPGRWNSQSGPVLYASEHYATALLEKLAGGNGELPPNQHYIEITVPPGVSYEVFAGERYPGWDDKESIVARKYGADWQQSGRSLLLIVPSIIARIERNVLFNPLHPEFAKVTRGLHQPVVWDKRLFRR